MEKKAKKIDLYLGSDLGLRALEQIPLNFLSKVITLDDRISDLAQSKGIKVIFGNANKVDFEPASIGFSIHYPRILKQDLISRYRKIYNLHPGYLPWGKGYYPIFWALWEDTRAGATLHEIVKGVDEGSIVEQIQVEHYPFDTGFSLFERVRAAEKKLFDKYFRKIARGETLPAASQPPGGTYHTKKEFFDLKRPENWQTMSAEELVRLIRCLSFPGYTGLEISLDGKKFSLLVEMNEES